MWDRAIIILVLSLAGICYVRGWRRLHRSSGRRLASGARLTSYLAGLGIIALALLSPLVTYSEALFSVHMLQHMLLMMAPLLLLLAAPLPIALWGLPSDLRHRLGRALQPRGVMGQALARLLSLRFAWPLFVLTVWAWHIPTFFQATLKNDLIHNGEHLSFFLTALLFWWPVVGAAPQLGGRIHYGLRMAYVGLALVQNTLLGSLITLSDRLYYEPSSGALLGGISALSDQRIAGMVMWVGMGMMYGIILLVLFYRMLSLEEAQARRTERFPSEEIPQTRRRTMKEVQDATG